jgi:hypothetical protein
VLSRKVGDGGHQLWKQARRSAARGLFEPGEEVGLVRGFGVAGEGAERGKKEKERVRKERGGKVEVVV